MEESQTAWQPVTPRGVAAFASAPWRRLLLVQFLVALLIGLAVLFVLRDGFCPTITNAIARLPAQGEIRGGRLAWQGDDAELLAEGRFVSVGVDLDHSGAARSLSHVQLELGRTNLMVTSLLGYLEIEYPNGWTIAVNSTELAPRWGAWRPPLLALLVGGIIIYLMVTWFGLATLYCGPVWLLGFFANRDLNLRASWRLCGAAVLPGALLMLGAISGYGAGTVDLVPLGFIFAAHILVTWIYLIWSPWLTPRANDAPARQRNPFTAAPH